MESLGRKPSWAAKSFFFLVSLSGLSAGCGDILPSGGGSGSELLDSTGLEMSSVEAFALEVSPTEGTNGLLAVLSDRTLVPVPMTEEGEGTISALHDTPLLLLAQVDGYKSGEDSCPMVALSKSDGALYCIPYQLIDLNVITQLPVPAPIQYAAGGTDVYFAGAESGSFSSGGLLKMTFDPDAGSPLTFVHASTATTIFTVNDAGDLLLGASQLYSMVSGGSLSEVFTASAIACMLAGSGADAGNAFFFAGTLGAELYKAVKGSGFTPSSLTMTDDAGGSGAFVPDCAPGTLSAVGGAWFATGSWTPSASSTAEMRLLKVSGTDAEANALANYAAYSGIQGAGSNLYLWGANSSGQAVLSRVAPSTLTLTSLFSVGSYGLTDVHVNSEETLYFAGTKSGAPILGKVAASGVTVTEIDPGVEIARIISNVPAEEAAAEE